MASRTRELKVAPGEITRRYSKEEIAILVSDWLNVFGKKRRAVSTQYLWEIFTCEYYPSVSGEEALVQYNQHEALEYIVFSNDRKCKVAFVTDQRPQNCSLSDYYVFPLNLAWTMAFTHEDGWCGPYFAIHSNYVALNAVNLAAIQKVREIENAKRKGWL